MRAEVPRFATSARNILFIFTTLGLPLVSDKNLELCFILT